MAYLDKTGTKHTIDKLLERINAAQETADSAEQLAESLEKLTDTAIVFKGVVDKVSDLPTDAKVGDLYHVTEDEGEYIWDGSEWQALGSVFDTSELQTQIQAAQKAAEDAQGTADSASSKADAAQSAADKAQEAAESKISSVSATSPIKATTSGTSVSVEHEESSVSSGTYGSSTAQTPEFGDTFSAPYVSTDTYGHITSAGTATVKIPATVATSSSDGLMSAADKKTIDELSAVSGITSVTGTEGIEATTSGTSVTVSGAALQSSITANSEAISAIGDPITNDEIDGMFEE